jgi:hypothetical protein
MDPLHVAHLIAVAAWAGLVLAEGALELGARDEASRRFAARLHYRLDLLFELPLLGVVLGTGSVLAARSWPFTTLHWVKVGAGLVPVAINLACVYGVVARFRAQDDPAALERWTRRILLAAVGAPFFLVAATLGLVYFRG